jgi:predicted O-methyltransferase YrrM
MNTNKIYDKVFNEVIIAIKDEYITKIGGEEYVANNHHQASTQAHDGSIKQIDIQHLPQLINKKIRNYLEIGSYIGVSFRILNEIFSPDVCYSVDPNIPHRVFAKPRNVFRKLNSSYLNKTTLLDAYWVQGGSPTIDSSYFTQLGIQFDLIFIDAMHTYESVKSDFFEAIKILSPDGLVLLHDVYTWPEVGQFVEELASDDTYIIKYSPKDVAIDGFCTIGINYAKNN